MKQLNVFESRKIRELFVNSFVDQTTERYKMIKEIDSQNVSLYLWDTLLKPFSTKPKQKCECKVATVQH